MRNLNQMNLSEMTQAELSETSGGLMQKLVDAVVSLYWSYLVVTRQIEDNI